MVKQNGHIFRKKSTFYLFDFLSLENTSVGPLTRLSHLAFSFEDTKIRLTVEYTSRSMVARQGSVCVCL